MILTDKQITHQRMQGEIGWGVGDRLEGLLHLDWRGLLSLGAEMRRNPPPLGNYALHLSEFKKVDGIMLPHKIDISLDGEPNEEWTIEKYKVNPQIKADLWEKK